MNEFYPVPKPKHKRLKQKRSSITRITKDVRKEVIKRSNGFCERCGKHFSWGMEMSHLIQASAGGSGSDVANVVLLCGPSVESGTCHHFADYTAEGREWRKQKREELKMLYQEKEYKNPE